MTHTSASAPVLTPRRLSAADWIGLGVLALLLVVGLSWSKWLPYWDKAWKMSQTSLWDGSPLFDAAGRVVGVNAQIYSQSGGFQGLAFSIPIDVALKVKDQIVAHGKVEHARLGVTLQDLSAPLASSFGLDAPDGALVSSVMPGSAAAKAGLKSGDVITAIDGQPVVSADSLVGYVRAKTVGEKIKLTIVRDGQQKSVTVTLGADSSSSS